MLKRLTIFIDIDGTVCEEGPRETRLERKPISGAVDIVNSYNEHHRVVFWTARGWDEYDGTKAWLDKHGFLYDQLIMGKPIAHIWIDDRVREFKGWDKDYLSEVLQKYEKN